MKKTTINNLELEKFNKIANEWWDPEGKFKPLHKFNPVRVNYLKINLIKHFNKKNSDKPLLGLNILDIGCGGGLLSEPISKLGANVTGIDASEKNIAIAKSHLKKSNLNIKYYCSSPENFKPKKKFDAILNMEIIEHVDNVDLYISSCFKLLKNNGLMFTATLNRTFISYIKAIIGAEYILRWLPIGTHDWNKFIKPEELEKILIQEKFSSLDIKGLKFNPFLKKWKKSEDLSVNYIICSKKN